MEQRRIDMQAWRARLPIVGRRRQPIRVDINCQRNRVMSPLTLVLALAQNSLSRRHSTRETAKLRLFLHLAGRSISGQYMHFSKSNPKLGERERGPRSPILMAQAILVPLSTTERTAPAFQEMHELSARVRKNHFGKSALRI
jgi:hypothetical protein